MAEKIDDVKVVMGRLIKVKNLKKHQAANADYIAIQVEDADGGNETCLLFTEHQIEEAMERANRNPEDLTKKNWITDVQD